MRAADLLHEHRAFAEGVRAARAAVLERRLARARALHAWFARAIRPHMEVEDDHLIPALAALGAEAPNGAPDVFRRDHALICRHIAQAGALLDGTVDAVGLSDALARLEGVLEHHDRREARYLLGRLDRDLPPERVAGWLADHPPLPPRPEGPDDVAPATERGPWAPGFDGARAALAAGDVAGAMGALEAPIHGSPKAERHRAAAWACLVRGDRVGAWDRLRWGRLALAATAGERG